MVAKDKLKEDPTLAFLKSFWDASGLGPVDFEDCEESGSKAYDEIVDAMALIGKGDVLDIINGVMELMQALTDASAILPTCQFLEG